MLKFDSIIRNLSLDEKISFISSSVKYQSFKVENYDLPRFEIKKSYEIEGANDYLKVSYKSLFSSWGINFANKYFNDIYSRVNSFETIFGVSIKDSSKKYVDGIYPDNYLLGSFAKLELDALNNKGYFSCITDFPRVYYDKFNFDDLAPYLIALSSNPSSVILKTHDSLDFINKQTDFKGFKFFEASTDEDTIYALNNGSIFVFYENTKEAILNALDKYEEEKVKLDSGLITNIEFEKLKNYGLILSSEKLDYILNEYFSMLLKLDDSFKPIEVKETIEKNNAEAENDISEAVILLKNNGSLPIEGSPKIGIIGDFAANFKTNNTILDFNYIVKKYELNITGYSHGFIEEDIDLDKVYDDASRIANDSDYTFVFLGKYNNRQYELPKKELDLVETIRKFDTKLIAIVNTDDLTNYKALDMCDAVIQTNILNKYGLNAIFDILFGITTPSGRTTRYYSYKNEGLDVTFDRSYDYALGHGLGYGIFDYSNLEVSKKGAIFTVKNSGAIGSFEVAQLYISTIDSKEMNFKLAGFKKMFIKPNESIKFIIPFDEFSFKTFDCEIQKFVIKKGKYQISICNEAGKIMLNEIVELDDFIYDDYKSTSEIDYSLDIKKAYQSLIKDEEKSSYIKSDRAHSKGKKIFIAILVAIYYNALFGFILAANLMGKKYRSVTISCALLIFVFDLFLVLYIIRTIKKEKGNKEKYDVNSDITKVIDDMENFDLVSEVTYEKPVKVVEDETIEEATNEEMIETPSEETQEEKELVVDKSINLEVDDSTYTKEIDFLAYTDDFIYYALNSGLIIEPRTARSILGALASSKMIFLKSQSMDLTLKFSEILTKYLNHTFNPIDLSKIDIVDKLYWTENNDVVSRSNLAIDLLEANTNNKKVYLETMYNVDVTNTSIYSDYLDYSLDSNNSVVVKIGEDESDKVLVNKNMIFLMIPSDENYLEKIDKKIADSSISIELFIRENEIIQEEPKASYTLSYTLLEQKIKENREKYYIDEDNWKKFDDVEEELNNIEKFSIDNRMTLAFEKMTSIMLEAGSDITEVIDYAIASRIIPQIKVMNSYKNAIDESNFKNILVNHFGDDVIPVSERELKKPL